MTVEHSDLTGSDLHVNKLHAATHKSGATDPIPLDSLGLPSDNVVLDTSINAHGLMPKLPNNSSEYFNGVGGWTIPGGLPSGAMCMWMTESPPTGWLECAGQSILRSAYPTLFAVIGTRYGVVDSAHFTLPDMRGYFPRGWDHSRGIDPDKATRTDRGDGTTGDAIGTKEAEGFKSHTHPIITHSVETGPSDVNAVTYGCTPVEGAAVTSSTGGNETRPININIMFIIKT